MPFNRLLVIDDEPDIAATVGRVARRAGFDTIATTDATDFLDRAMTWSPTVIVLDLNMPEVDGLKLLENLAAQRSRAHVLIVSGHDRAAIDDAKAFGQTLGLNMVGVLQKPLRAETLSAALRTIFDDEALISAEEMRQAIGEGEFFLDYHPIVRLRAARLIGVEGLARWRHKRRGVILPDDFIPMMQSAGLMRAFTPLVVDMAVAQSRAWRDRGTDLRVSVNISGGCVAALVLDDIIAHSCAAHRVDPASLTVEITETAAMDDVDRVAACMTNLNALGVRISIDDFGTGYSSLVQLHRLPLSEIKIDKSFVLDCAANRECRLIIKTIVSLAQSLSLAVVAEGIETQVAFDCVAEAGCRIGQGYLFSRPLAAERIPTWRSPEGVG